MHRFEAVFLCLGFEEKERVKSRQSVLLALAV